MPSNYRVQVRYDREREAYVARAPELPRCEAEGATRAEALAHLEQEIAAQVATIEEQGGTPPTPVDELAPPADEGASGDDAVAAAPRGEVLDGRIAAKVSPGLHRELVYEARAESLPIDVLVAELLAESLALRTARTLRGAPRRDRDRGRDRGRGNRRRGQDGNRRRGSERAGYSYDEIMEDKGAFLDYVRGLEQGQGGRRGGGRRRRRRDRDDER